MSSFRNPFRFENSPVLSLETKGYYRISTVDIFVFGSPPIFYMDSHTADLE